MVTATRTYEPIPADAEVYGTLKIYRYDATGGRVVGAACVKVWSGKAKKPYANYRFPSAAARERYIGDEKNKADVAVAHCAARDAKAAADLAAMLAAIQPGSILHYAWGYDQTQCEFFQVISRTAKKAVIREIRAASIPGSDTGGMCDRRRPVKDEFIGEPAMKSICAFGARMKYGAASPLTAAEMEQGCYCSWYA